MARKRTIRKAATDAYVMPSGWSDAEKQYRMENRQRAVTIQSRKRTESKNACRGPVRPERMD